MYFSIIIPVYNAQKYILNCITSIKKQTFSDFECLLINDGSTDESQNTILNEISRDSRFTLYKKENGGVSSARNLGLDNAKGEFIIFIDSDDWIEPNLLEEIIKVSNDNDIIQYDFYKVSTRNGKKTKQEIHIKSDVKLILQGEGAVIWKRAFRRSFIKNIKFDEAFAGGEDYLFCSTAFLQKPRITFIEKCLYNYNISNENSAMSKNSISTFIDQLLVTKKVEALLKEKNLIELYQDNIYERYFWCLAEFNNWWLTLRNKNPKIKRILVKIIKIILKKF